MNSLYMYGVVAADKPLSFEVDGLAGGLRVIAVDDIGAIVGAAPGCQLHGLPREETVRLLAAHQQVLEAAMVQTTVLPVKFGALAPGEDAVRRMLIDGRALLCEQLKEFTDHLQIEVVARWRLDQVMAELRECVPENGEEQSGVGRALAAALERRRALLSEEICGVLSTVATDMATTPPQDHHVAADLTLLLNKTDMGSLEGMLNRLDAEMAGEVDFRATGPQPLSSFATVEVTFPQRAAATDTDWLVDASTAASLVMINIVREQMQPPVYGVAQQENIA